MAIIAIVVAIVYATRIGHECVVVARRVGVGVAVPQVNMRLATMVQEAVVV